MFLEHDATLGKRNATTIGELVSPIYQGNIHPLLDTIQKKTMLEKLRLTTCLFDHYKVCSLQGLLLF